jgi:cysteinyl-tRNA synthetase
MKYLGESFDIHTGGIDNIFPHHDDEIAQSEAATGKQFVKYWLHCAHLIVEGQKMSKSLGNFYTLRDILDKGYSGREIRYVLISTHYRQPLNFTFEALDGARASLKRLDEFAEKVQDIASQGSSAETFTSWAAEYRAKFRDALDDDLNISGALGALFDMVHAGNKIMDRNELSPPEALATMALWNELDQVLAVLRPDEEEADPEVKSMLRLREEARGKQDWKEADRLREEIYARGWIVQDGPDGSRLKRR